MHAHIHCMDLHKILSRMVNVNQNSLEALKNYVHVSHMHTIQRYGVQTHNTTIPPTHQAWYKMNPNYATIVSTI